MQPGGRVVGPRGVEQHVDAQLRVVATAPPVRVVGAEEDRAVGVADDADDAVDLHGRVLAPHVLPFLLASGLGRRPEADGALGVLVEPEVLARPCHREHAAAVVVEAARVVLGRGARVDVVPARPVPAREAVALPVADPGAVVHVDRHAIEPAVDADPAGREGVDGRLVVTGRRQPGRRDPRAGNVRLEAQRAADPRLAVDRDHARCPDAVAGRGVGHGDRVAAIALDARDAAVVPQAEDLRARHGEGVVAVARSEHVDPVARRIVPALHAVVGGGPDRAVGGRRQGVHLRHAGLVVPVAREDVAGEAGQADRRRHEQQVARQDDVDDLVGDEAVEGGEVSALAAAIDHADAVRGGSVVDALGAADLLARDAGHVQRREAVAVELQELVGRPRAADGGDAAVAEGDQQTAARPRDVLHVVTAQAGTTIEAAQRGLVGEVPFHQAALGESRVDAAIERQPRHHTVPRDDGRETRLLGDRRRGDDDQAEDQGGGAHGGRRPEAGHPHGRRPSSPDVREAFR